MTNPAEGAHTGPIAAFMRRPYLILILTNLFWGGNVVAGKMAVGEIDPYVLMILRWIGALLLILPFAIEPLKKAWPILKAHWPLYLFYGAIGYASFNMLNYVAAHYTTGVNIAMEQVTINFIVMGLNFAIFGVRAWALQIVGAIITVAGVAVVATHGELGRLLSLSVNLGDLLVLGSCVIWAAYSLALKYRPPTDWRAFFVATGIGATLASVVFLLVFGGGAATFPAQVAAVTPTGWLIVLYTIVFPSVVSQMFYVRGVELIGANRASLFINLIPFFGIVGSVLLLGESLETFHFVAGALIIAGIVLAEWSARKGEIVVSEP